MKGFDQILHELESGKISAEQAKGFIRELLQDTRDNNSVPAQSKEWYQTGVDCAMIRLNLKDWEDVAR